MVHEGSGLRCRLGNTYFQRQSRVCTHISSVDIFILYRYYQKNLTLITGYNLRFVTDATVAVFIAVLLFVLPSKAPRFCPGRSQSFEPGAVWETQPITHLNMLRTSCQASVLTVNLLGLQRRPKVLRQPHDSSAGKLSRRSYHGESCSF